MMASCWFNGIGMQRNRRVCKDWRTTLDGLIREYKIVIEETFREAFFFKIEDAINYRGGTIMIYDTIDLQLTRTP